MRIVVYTAIFGDIDKLWPPYPPAMAGAEFVCFSDRHIREWGNWEGEKLVTRDRLTAGGPFWDLRLIRPTFDNRRNARYCKAMSHKFFPEADITIWLDGNLRLLISPDLAVQKWDKGADLVTFNHPDRGCLYAEAEFCASKRKAKRSELARQTQRYSLAGMPRNWGLPETRCVIRKHTERIKELNGVWWDEMREFSPRDQVSLPFLCWKAGIRWGVIPGRAWVSGDHINTDFWFTRHGKKGQQEQ